MIDIPELLDLAISFLETGDLLTSLKVSRLWYQIALPHLWRNADGQNCDGPWPCIHKLTSSSSTEVFGPNLEKYRHFIWSMNWTPPWILQYYSSVLHQRRSLLDRPSSSSPSSSSSSPPSFSPSYLFPSSSPPPSLKELCIPEFNPGACSEIMEQLESVLTDTGEAFENPWMGNPIQHRDTEISLVLIRFLWQFILDNPGLQRLEFSGVFTVLPVFDFKGPDITGQTSPDFMLSRIATSPGGEFLTKVFKTLTQLRHLSAPRRENAVGFLQVLANLARSSTSSTITTTTTTTTTISNSNNNSIATLKTNTATATFPRGPSSLRFTLVNFRLYLPDEITLERHRRLLENLTNDNIRRLDVEEMHLVEIDTVMTIMPKLELLHIHKSGGRAAMDPAMSLFLESDQWTLDIQHHALKMLRHEVWVTGLLASHVIWTNLDRFVGDQQRLLWGMGLLLERMPRVQHVELGNNENECKPKYSVVQQYKAKEAAFASAAAANNDTGTGTFATILPPRPLDVKTLIVRTILNRTNSAMLSLLPRMPLLTRLELNTTSTEILTIIARDCLLLEHLKLTCNRVFHRELYMILMSCSRLKTVRGSGLEIRAIDLIQRPLSCLGLEEFEVAIKSVPRMNEEQTNTLRKLRSLLELEEEDVLMEDGEDNEPSDPSQIQNQQRKQIRQLNRRQQRSIGFQREVMEQLARFTKLRVLILSFKKPNLLYGNEYDHGHFADRSTLELSLGTGLDLLVTLQELEIFGFNEMDHHLGLQELSWISDHWPKIKSVDGTIRTSFGLWVRPPVPEISHSYRSYMNRRGGFAG
ncbi:hypothetical protein BGZ83_001917 [Gryganskiella cystojenkinii]|nr:hypothetical protein BGZ83_001917 [Gryganskiella cystojenkinii]